MKPGHRATGDGKSGEVAQGSVATKLMRVVELVNNLEVGGTERLVVDLSIALRDRGHSVSVACLRGGGPLQGMLNSAGIDVVTFAKREGPSLRTALRLMTYLKSNAVDVIHTHNPLVHHYGVAAARLAGVPVIVNTIHGPSNLSRKSGPKELLFAATSRLTSGVVAVCPTAHQMVLQRAAIPPSLLTTINNGIVLDSLLKASPRPPDGAFVFGIVGRLAPVKDHRSLLEAFALLVKSRPRVRLSILGDGPMRNELVQQTSRLGLSERVRFHGHGADVPRFFSSIDVTILCSLSEGLPLSVLESMAAAVPVIGTRVGETENLIQSAQCGWLCPPANPEMLAAAMLLAVDTDHAERAAMGLRARNFVVANYSHKQMTEAYEALFLRLLAQRQPRYAPAH